MPSIKEATSVPSWYAPWAKVLLPHEHIEFVIENGKMQAITTVTSNADKHSIQNAYERYINMRGNIQNVPISGYVWSHEIDTNKVCFALESSNTIDDFNVVLQALWINFDFEKICVEWFWAMKLQNHVNFFTWDSQMYWNCMKDDELRWKLISGSWSLEDKQLLAEKKEIYQWYFLLLKRYLQQRNPLKKTLDPLSY